MAVAASYPHKRLVMVVMFPPDLFLSWGCRQQSPCQAQRRPASLPACLPPPGLFFPAVGSLPATTVSFQRVPRRIVREKGGGGKPPERAADKAGGSERRGGEKGGPKRGWHASAMGAWRAPRGRSPSLGSGALSSAAKGPPGSRAVATERGAPVLGTGVQRSSLRPRER